MSAGVGSSATRRGAGAALRAALLASSALAIAALPARAQTAQNWTGNTSTDWFIVGNWDTNTVPAAGDSATLSTVTPNSTVVDGAGGGAPTIDLSGLNVGFTGPGSLTINNGATFNVNTGDAVIGGDLSGVLGSNNNTGAVVVDGSTFTVTGSPPTTGKLVVGGSGTGSFTVQNGATVSTADSYVGFGPGSSGTVTITGATSTWTNSGDNTVGNFGTGIFSVDRGGTVNVTGNTFVGANPTGNGTINISRAGSSWTTTGVTILGGGLSFGVGGSGTINVSNGGAYNANADMYIALSVPAPSTCRAAAY